MIDWCNMQQTREGVRQETLIFFPDLFGERSQILLSSAIVIPFERKGLS